MKLHEIAYGTSFGAYSDPGFDEFLQPLEDRFRVNGINADEVFGDKVCLDAGCGGGRGTVFMLRHGAAKVISMDLSETNIESTRFRCRQAEFSNVELHLGNLEKLPFDNESMDVVFSNGVLHHSDHPDDGLTESARVLKKGGNFWLYLYAECFDWYWNVRLRKAQQPYSPQQALSS